MVEHHQFLNNLFGFRLRGNVFIFIIQCNYKYEKSGRAENRVLLLANHQSRTEVRVTSFWWVISDRKNPFPYAIDSISYSYIYTYKCIDRSDWILLDDSQVLIFSSSRLFSARLEHRKNMYCNCTFFSLLSVLSNFSSLLLFCKVIFATCGRLILYLCTLYCFHFNDDDDDDC